MKLEVLDNGYVEFVEAWGHGCGGENVLDPQKGDEHDYEVGIIEAARQSTQGSFRGWEKDEKLLKFLFEHKHNTPFEFAGMVIEVQAPIFVFREWHRHRTQSYNEMSARYEPLPDLYYLPDRTNLIDRIVRGMDTKNKQEAAGIYDATMTDIDSWAAQVADTFLGKLNYEYAECEGVYQKALHSGIPKELARCIMPVGHYSRMRASANLRNWLGFLTLRMDPAAQYEIRCFANAVGEIIKVKFPRVWALFEEEMCK